MSAISWAFNFVPWWAWVVAVAITLLATIHFWAPFWSLAPRPVKVALGAIGAVLAAYVAGRNRGSKDERDQRAKADARAVQTRKDTDDEVRNLPAADVDRRLNGWMRDGD